MTTPALTTPAFQLTDSHTLQTQLPAPLHGLYERLLRHEYAKGNLPGRFGKVTNDIIALIYTDTPENHALVQAVTQRVIDLQDVTKDMEVPIEIFDAQSWAYLESLSKPDKNRASKSKSSAQSKSSTAKAKAGNSAAQLPQPSGDARPDAHPSEPSTATLNNDEPAA